MKKNIVLKKAKKSTYGITLIALVVTIVILIILATISINLLIKAGGIISKAKESAVINNINQKKESVQMVIATKTIEKLSGEKKIASVEEVLGEIQKSENSTAIYAMKDNKVITATEGTTKFGASFLFPKETTGINTGIRIDVDDKLNITNAVKAEVEEATKEESAGVYDSEGNLIASWDRLKNEYKLDIEKNYDKSTCKTNNSDGNSMYYVLNQDEFKEKTGLKIIIPSSVTSIGRYAFGNCSSLDIKVPSTVETIEDESAFEGCKSVTYENEKGRDKYFGN